MKHVHVAIDLHKQYEKIMAQTNVEPLTGKDWEQMFKPMSLKHGAHKAFVARLCDAMFNISQEDIAEEKERLMNEKGMIEEQADQEHFYNYKYLLRNCRRHIPLPDVLVEDLSKVHAEFASLLDSKSDIPLFNAETEHAWLKLLQHVKKGCVSDVPGVPLYYNTLNPSGTKSPLRCARGTNSLEGFHLHLRRLFDSAYNNNVS